MCIRQKILFLILIMGGVLINASSGYAVVGAEWILKPRPLWNKIVEAGLDHKIYVYEINTSDRNKIEFGETINVNIEQLWKESLRQTLMYGYVLTYEGKLETELEERKGERVDAQLVTVHSLTKEEKQILELKGASKISEVQGKENLYLITLPLDESIIEILKLEFVELLQGVEGEFVWNQRMGFLTPAQQVSMAPANINIQIHSDILPLYQVVENSDKLDHPLRTLIGYKKEKLRSLVAQRAPFLADSLNISAKDDEIMVDIFITYIGGDKEIEKIRTVGVNAYPPISDGTTSITSARVPINLLPEIVKLSCVKSVSISTNYQLYLDRSYLNSSVNLVQSYPSSEGWKGYDGKDVIVGIIDTGIDINHEDFKDENGMSRILYIWDQTDNSGSKPWGYDYGTEWMKNDIDGERCTEKDTEGHGTHVAGIAAGDGSASGNGYLPYTYVGMSPKADIIVVKLQFDAPIGDSITGNLIHIRNGLQYIESKANSLGKKFVVNMSLGTHLGAHDDTSPIEKAIDIVVRNGGQVVVAAGNEGDDRIHAEGKIFTNNTETITFNVPNYTPNPGNQNDIIAFDMWYAGADTITVTVSSPRGMVLSRTTGQPFNAIGSRDGAIQIENSSGGVDPNNYDNRCIIYVFDYSEQDSPRQGEWNITVTGNNIKKDGKYDIWIANSDLGGQHASFAEKNFSRAKLVSIPATANYAITVGAYCTKGSWTDSSGNRRSYSSYPKIGDIASFSSPGPTRDGRLKPEIVAPGFGIASARAVDSSVPSDRVTEDGKHCIMRGTSMSAPHVTGVVALMLQAMPNLWRNEYKDNLTKLARRDDFTGTIPNNIWGYGKLNANFLGGIQGKVTEKDGKTPIPNAAVRVIQNSIEKETIYTSKEGVYKLLFLVTGTYDVKVDAYACKITERKGIKVEIGELTPDINFSLEKKDTTPPTIPIISDDGIYTNNATQLHASWLSSDQESGVVEYQYAIGNTKGGVDIVNWTSTGAMNNVIKAGLKLINGITYYFSVKARNSEGLWSGIGYSDGIKIISPGSISGTVTTSTGIPLSNIVISIQNIQNTVTDKTGRYKLVNIPVGSYVVNAKIEGSDITETKKNILVESEKETDNINFTIDYTYKYYGKSIYNSSRHGENYEYYLQAPADYEIYDWGYSNSETKRSRDDGTFIDAVGNRLIIKVRLDGKWNHKARYSANYWIWTRKPVIEEYESGGNNQSSINETLCEKTTKIYYLSPSDTKYQLFKWENIVHQAKNAWDEGSYIDKANNRLVIKVRYEGSTIEFRWRWWHYIWKRPASYSATYYVYGRKGVGKKEAVVKIPVKIIEETTTIPSKKHNSMIMLMQDRSSSHHSLQLANRLEEKSNIAIMVKDIEEELTTVRLKLSYNPDKIKIEDVSPPTFEDATTKVYLEKEIDNQAGKIDIGMVIVDEDDVYREEKGTITDEIISKAKNLEVDEEVNIAPIAYLTIGIPQGVKAPNIQQLLDQAIDCIDINEVELKDANGNAIDVTVAERDITKSNLNSNLNDVCCYPNPTKEGWIIFAKLTERVKVKIFNVSGELVYEGEHTTNNGEWTWQCVNNNGKRVASGMYSYIVQDVVGGSIKKGEFGVIR